MYKMKVMKVMKVISITAFLRFVISLILSYLHVLDYREDSIQLPMFIIVLVFLTFLISRNSQNELVINLF